MAPSSRRAAGVGPPSGKSGKRAPGRRAGRGTSGGARGRVRGGGGGAVEGGGVRGGPRVKKKAGPPPTRARPARGAGGAPPLYPGFIPGGSDDLRWAAKNHVLYNAFRDAGPRGIWL